MNSNDDELRYYLLKILEQNPKMTQRELAQELGVSLGKANYCLREMVKAGFVKASRFKASSNKRAYAYLLTPSGVREKSKVAMHFLQRKLTEYELIKHEIDRLRAELKI